MTYLDGRGLSLSPSSGRAARRDREGVDLLLSAWTGVAEHLGGAMVARPGFAPAHVARARRHAMRLPTTRAHS